MRVEVPVFVRCCFCLPLRYGLLIWGYLALLLDIFLIYLSVLEMPKVVWNLKYQDWLGVDRFVLTFGNQLFNFGLTILLIVASHKKDTKLFKIYYFYAIILAVTTCLLVVSDLLFDLMLYHHVDGIWKSVLSQVLIGVIFICLLLYIIALVRSEILKLENRNKLEFANIAVEANGNYYEKEISQTGEENIHTDRHTHTEHNDVENVTSTKNELGIPKVY